MKTRILFISLSDDLQQWIPPGFSFELQIYLSCRINYWVCFYHTFSTTWFVFFLKYKKKRLSLTHFRGLRHEKKKIVLSHKAYLLLLIIPLPSKIHVYKRETTQYDQQWKVTYCYHLHSLYCCFHKTMFYILFLPTSDLSLEAYRTKNWSHFVMLKISIFIFIYLL